MSNKSRAMRLTNRLLLMLAGLGLVASLFVGISLAVDSDVNQVAQVVLLDATTQAEPLVMAPGEEGPFTVQVRSAGEEVTAASLSMTFDPTRLEVVDSLPAGGVQIAPHPDNPLTQFTVENEVDNAAGTIKYTVGSQIPASGDFNLAVITFRAKDNPTAPGAPTEVVFLVDNGDETAITWSGQQLLAASSDFIGAWISIERGREVEVVMLPITTAEAPGVMGPGEESSFTVQVQAGSEEVTAASLSMTFDRDRLEIVDALPAGGVQIAPHPDNPLTQFTVENEVDNASGTIKYTVGSQIPASGDFNLAVITFRAKDNPTAPGVPTEVVFLVDNGNETAITRSGQQLLANTSDFTGAWIEIAAPQAWTGDLTVSALDDTFTPIAGGLALVFGIQPDATVGFDLGIDGVAPPPPPSPPFI